MNDIPKIIMGITSNEDLMRALGLKGCPACKSGLDFRIRELLTPWKGRSESWRSRTRK